MKKLPIITPKDSQRSEEKVTEIRNGETYEYYPIGEYIVRAMGVCGGRPTFKYTRIEISGALDRLNTGENIDDMIEGYRGLVSREAILEAIRLEEERQRYHDYCAAGESIAEALESGEISDYEEFIKELDIEK